MMRKMKREIADWIRDTREIYFRNFPGPLTGLKNHNLSETQIFPIGNNLFEGISKGTKKRFTSLQVRPDMPMASIGTCFAEEFATYLKENPGAGTYLYSEPNVFNSSANWGRVYTIKNLRQIIEYSLGDLVPIYTEKTKKGYIDPLREFSTGTYQSEAEITEHIQQHRALSKEVFIKAKIIVITLGQNETWFDTEKNIYWGSAPSSDLRKSNPNRFSPIEFSYQSNKEDLDFIIKTIKQYNPEVNIIVTVSPVGAYATFLTDDIVSQSFAGKCTLRAVVHEVIKENNSFTYYYPSFELVLCDNPTSYIADNRHVKRKKVKQIFHLLGEILQGK
ncbi:GSCFA domain-containing protein [Aquirufa aurantiipilula]